tara:strand:- start:317 stop:490 length:174 start_codon:yes stop_codon:yes gene_type:complete
MQSLVENGFPLLLIGAALAVYPFGYGRQKRTAPAKRHKAHDQPGGPPANPDAAPKDA